MIHFTFTDTKGLNSLRADDSRSGPTIFYFHVDMYLLLTFFISAITGDLTFSPVRQLQLCPGEAGSTNSACFDSTVFCIWVQLQQSWTRKKYPHFINHKLEPTMTFASQSQKSSYQYHCWNFLSQISDAQCSSLLETSVHFPRELLGKSYQAQSSADLY